MSSVALIAGRPDQPTDAVKENSLRLAKELRKRGRDVTTLTVDWGGVRFWRSLRELRGALSSARPSWVVLHYTGLAWGWRACPVFALFAARAALRSGARLAIDFHEDSPWTGSRPFDRVRSACQLAVMRRLARNSSRIFVHIPPEVGASWLPKTFNPIFLPSGSNIAAAGSRHAKSPTDPFSILVFCLTDSIVSTEGAQLAAIVQMLAPLLGTKRCHLQVIGRGAEGARETLESQLGGTGVDLVVKGLLPEEQISAALQTSDVFLFLRREISPSRSTAVAALEHGLPIVAYASRLTVWPITEAGLLCVPYGDVDEVVEVLAGLARDDVLRAELSARSLYAYDRYFSWDRIAEIASTALNDLPS